MPTYDYRCKQCGARFEVKRGMTDESSVLCAKCQSADTTKLVTGAPHIAISWKNTLGLGHSGQIALPAVLNKRLMSKVGRRTARARNRAKQHLMEEPA
jgi:putative FmdB family regulatory protein